MAAQHRQIISLYTGAGGLDFGLEAAGFQTAVAVENDPDAVDVLRRNRDWPVLARDISTITTTELLAAADLDVGEVDLLAGGPPCQPFSKSGYWASGDARRLDDARADTLTAFLRVLRDTQPKAFLIENVHGLVYKDKDEGLTYLRDGLTEINRQTRACYRLDWDVLNAVDHGVPQFRRRVFLIGRRDGEPFRFPRATHRSEVHDDDLIDGEREPALTTWDALGDLPEVPSTSQVDLTLSGKWGSLIAAIPEGHNYLWHTDRGGGLPLFGWRTRYWSFLLKLAKDRPSWTIQAQPGPATGPFHWNSRKLSIQEMGRLQTFPDDVMIDTNHRTGQRLLGNAVPALLGEVLGQELQKQVFGASVANRPLLRPEPRRDRPIALPPSSVPESYIMPR